MWINILIVISKGDIHWWSIDVDSFGQEVLDLGWTWWTCILHWWTWWREYTDLQTCYLQNIVCIVNYHENLYPGLEKQSVYQSGSLRLLDKTKFNSSYKICDLLDNASRESNNEKGYSKGTYLLISKGMPLWLMSAIEANKLQSGCC